MEIRVWGKKRNERKILKNSAERRLGREQSEGALQKCRFSEIELRQVIPLDVN